MRELMQRFLYTQWLLFLCVCYMAVANQQEFISQKFGSADPSGWTGVSCDEVPRLINIGVENLFGLERLCYGECPMEAPWEMLTEEEILWKMLK
ncbi:hypothetical protein CYMTET_28289 [Cymbomonas tetramitiformis]|uniref:Uncharacterized protein n=1 Tax=Cymbomonas tetramitiformis TaxID=36881 RepID=A0AAE0FN46_9CHLO|nr:hypothetical protein CYMTET_28289 [Cymbomonas tetramitiformis]